MQTTSDSNPWQKWKQLAQNPAISLAISQIHQNINQDVAQKQPVCDASGKCCRFKEYGHRLYVTGIEIAWVLNQLDTTATIPNIPTYQSSDLQLTQLSNNPQLICPYHIDGLCAIHKVRPMGCRLYFCDGTDEWQNSRYEHYQSLFKELHNAHNIPYAYMEWTHGVKSALSAKQ